MQRGIKSRKKWRFARAGVEDWDIMLQGWGAGLSPSNTHLSSAQPPWSGSTHAPQLQQAGTLGKQISSFLSSQGNILNHPKDFWTGARKDGKPTQEPSWRVTFYFWWTKLPVCEISNWAVLLFTYLQDNLDWTIPVLGFSKASNQLVPCSKRRYSEILSGVAAPVPHR